jgi:hypothetical protein
MATADAWLKPGSTGTGTITITPQAPTTLSGSGTNFDPQLQAGDYIYYESVNGEFAQAQIASITNDTTAVLEASPVASACTAKPFNYGVQSMPMTIDTDKSENGVVYELNPSAVSPHKILVPGPAVTAASAANKWTASTAPTTTPPDIYEDPAWMLSSPAGAPLTVTGDDGVTYTLIPNTGGAHTDECYVPPLAINAALAAGWSLV